MSMTMLFEFFIATGETLYMVLLSTLFSVILGLPLGTLLFSSTKIKPHKLARRLTSGCVNVVRSVPFIILLVALIPVTRLIVGTSIGLHAAIVPLSIGAIPFFARLVDNVYQTLPAGLVETGFAMGCSPWQMIRRILIPEALPALIQAITVTAVTLVNYSAMAGTVGGGGLGDLAIRYGYQRFNTHIILATVLVLVIIVQLLQIVGDRLSNYFVQH